MFGNFEKFRKFSPVDSYPWNKKRICEVHNLIFMRSYTVISRFYLLRFFLLHNYFVSAHLIVTRLRSTTRHNALHFVFLTPWHKFGEFFNPIVCLLAHLHFVCLSAHRSGFATRTRYFQHTMSCLRWSLFRISFRRAHMRRMQSKFTSWSLFSTFLSLVLRV